MFLTLGGAVVATSPAGAATSPSGCTPGQDGSTWTLGQDVTCYGVQIGHKCVVIGTVGNSSAAECSDVYVNTDASTGEAEIWGNGEYYCQGTYDQCEGMNVSNTFNLNSSSAAFKCNDTSSLCPNGGRQNVGTKKIEESEINFNNPLDVSQCYSVTASDPAGEVIAVYGASAFHSSSAETTSVELCFSPKY